MSETVTAVEVTQCAICGKEIPVRSSYFIQMQQRVWEEGITTLHVIGPQQFACSAEHAMKIGQRVSEELRRLANLTPNQLMAMERRD